MTFAPTYELGASSQIFRPIEFLNCSKTVNEIAVQPGQAIGPEQPDQVWGMHFVFDEIFTDLKFKTQTMVGNCHQDSESLY